MSGSNSTDSSTSQGGVNQWWKSTIELLRPQILERLKIVDLATPESTMQAIERDTEFRGFNLWILVFSIFIASIGLNVNSTAVIIGAMLISPLMGPIMGIGLGVGVNNVQLILRSVGNLGVAVGISILASAVYFVASPIDEAGSELLARTNPTLLDVLVAFFGGITGILAGSRKERNNVIPGVAIATALMPPLCTAGYGLAHLDGGYFFGALYLFLINAILIAASTTVVVRYLRFPLVQHVDAATERKYKRYFGMGLAALLLPSAFILYNTVTESVQSGKLSEFVTNTVKHPGVEVVKKEIEYVDGSPEAHVVLLGASVPADIIEQWQGQLSAFMPQASMTIVQNDGPTGLEDLQRMVNLYAEGQTALSMRDAELVSLRSELANLKGQDLPNTLPAEILVQAPEVRSVSVANRRILGRQGKERVVPWVDVELALADSVDSTRMEALEQQLEAWLLLRLEADSVVLDIQSR
jgi:uncharacterized hydrophobic protein (TIGR00271 family)